MELVITVNAQGAVNVRGPIENKLVSYGMLELAREAIAKYHDAKPNGIVAASPLDAARLAGN